MKSSSPNPNLFRTTERVQQPSPVFFESVSSAPVATKPTALKSSCSVCSNCNRDFFSTAVSQTGLAKDARSFCSVDCATNSKFVATQYFDSYTRIMSSMQREKQQELQARLDRQQREQWQQRQQLAQQQQQAAHREQQQQREEPLRKVAPLPPKAKLKVITHLEDSDTCMDASSTDVDTDTTSSRSRLSIASKERGESEDDVGLSQAPRLRVTPIGKRRAAMAAATASGDMVSPLVSMRKQAGRVRASSCRRLSWDDSDNNADGEEAESEDDEFHDRTSSADVPAPSSAQPLSHLRLASPRGVASPSSEHSSTYAAAFNSCSYNLGSSASSSAYGTTYDSCSHARSGSLRPDSYLSNRVNYSDSESGRSCSM